MIYLTGFDKMGTMKCPTCGSQNPSDARFCKSCGSELSTQAKTEQIPGISGQSCAESDPLSFDDFILNKRFKILRRLGKGGMGTIFHARDVRLKRDVAIKCISEKTLKDGGSKARFLREAQTASQLEHPNICTIYEIYEEERNNYIVMQYVDGVTLEQIIRLKKLSSNKILDIANQICEGMIEAHSKEIIHRDIKPANIMVDNRGKVKILDFGLAKFRDESMMKKKDMIDSTNLTEKGILMGTATYMSPEQARGEELDVRSDVFSFGVVLYEMIEGVNPFLDEDHISTLYNVINKPVDFIRNVPGELKNLVERTLEKKAADRPDDFRSIKRDLDKIIRVQQEKEEKPHEQVKTEIIGARDRDRIIQEMQKTSDQEGLGDIVYRIKKIKAPTEPVVSARSPLLKILAIPVILVLVAMAILIFTGKESGDILIPDPQKVFYVYLHDVDDQTGDKDFSEKLNYLLFQSFNQFPEFKTINEEIAGTLYDRPGGSAGDSGTLVETNGTQPPLMAVKHESGVRPGMSPDILGFLSGEFNLLFEVKARCSCFNGFYNIDAVLAPVMRGKKSFHITIPIKNKDALLQSQVDTFTLRLVENIFQTPGADFSLKRISDMFGDDWATFSHFFRGVRHYKKLRFNLAENSLNEVLDLPLAKYYLADIYYFNGKREEAIGLVEEILPRLDGLTDSFRYRILALKSRLDFNLEEEVRHLHRLKNAFPFLIDAVFELGEAHFHRGNAEKAIPFYQKAIGMNRNYSKAINHLGYCYSYLGEHRRAIQLFEDYRNLDRSANSFDSLGDGYFYAGDLMNAESMKLAAVSKDPKGVPWSYLTLADIYILRAEYEKARSALRSYVELTGSKKERARTLAKQAHIFMLERQYRNALDLLNQSISTYDSQDINDYTVSEAHWLRGMVLLAVERLEDGERDLAWLDGIRRKFNLSPQNFYIPLKYLIHLQALISERKGDLESAESGFLSLLSLKTRLSYWVTSFHYPFFHTEYIRFLKRCGRKLDALKEIDACLKFNSSYIPCLWEKAGLLKTLGKPSEAQAVYGKITRLVGESPEANLFRKRLKERKPF